MHKGVIIIADTQALMYQLTINDPLEKGYTHEHILEIFHRNFKTLVYLCMADEKGTLFHTHIFVVFSSRVRFSMIKRYFKEAHIEKCRGTISDNIAYVSKSGKWENDSKQETKIEGSFEEYGTRPPDSRGKRYDMSELYQMVLDNMTNAEILAVNQDYILQIDKIDKVRTTILTERFKDSVRLDMEVCYISGHTGTGKTRLAFVFQLVTILIYLIYLYLLSECFHASLTVYMTAEYLFVILLGIQSILYLKRKSQQNMYFCTFND